jgi:hypothetical protein
VHGTAGNGTRNPLGRTARGEMRAGLRVCGTAFMLNFNPACCAPIFVLQLAHLVHPRSHRRYSAWLFCGVAVIAVLWARLIRYMRIHPGMKAFSQVRPFWARDAA